MKFGLHIAYLFHHPESRHQYLQYLVVAYIFCIVTVVRKKKF
jgi:hypothetical protein